MADTDLEAIVDAGMKRKSKISLYDECKIPINGTRYFIKKQKLLLLSFFCIFFCLFFLVFVSLSLKANIVNYFYSLSLQ